MSKYLLDTNICAFLLRGKFDIDKRIREVGVENCCISEITIAELLYGVECSLKPAENLRTVQEFCNDLDIVSIDQCLYIFAKEKFRLRKSGLIIDDFDLLIASTAIYYNYILVSDNTKHFNRLDVKLENWINRS